MAVERARGIADATPSPPPPPSPRLSPPPGASHAAPASANDPPTAPPSPQLRDEGEAGATSTPTEAPEHTARTRRSPQRHTYSHPPEQGTHQPEATPDIKFGAYVEDSGGWDDKVEASVRRRTNESIAAAGRTSREHRNFVEAPIGRLLTPVTHDKTGGGISVLSLFDGMGCLYESLERLGVPIQKYIAIEISADARALALALHPGTTHPPDCNGDVNNVVSANLATWFGNGPIHLIAGGPPCQRLSSQNKNRVPGAAENWELIAVYEKVREWARMFNHRQGFGPPHSLMECVPLKDEKEREAVNELTGLRPMTIESALVAPCLRKRAYWTTLKVEPMPASPPHNDLSDLVHADGLLATRRKALCITASVPASATPLDVQKKLFPHDGTPSNHANLTFVYRPMGTRDGNLPAPATDDSRAQREPGQWETLSLRHIAVAMGHDPDKLVATGGSQPLPLLEAQPTQTTAGKLRHAIGNGWSVQTIRHLLCAVKAWPVVVRGAAGGGL